MVKPLQTKMLPVGKDVELFNERQLFVALHDALRDEVADGVRFMSRYPAKPGRSTYRRTGTLRRSWFFKISSGMRRITGLVGSNANVAPYNVRVQGDDQLPHFERIGWRDTKTLSRVLGRSFTRRIERIFGNLK